MEKELLQNPREYEASTGEKLEMHFRLVSLPLLSRIQRNLIETRLNQDPHLKVEKIESSNGELIVTVVIKDNPFPLVLAIGGIITILSGFFIWGSLDKVYKIIETPEGTIFGISTSVGIITSIIIVGILLFRRA